MDEIQASWFGNTPDLYSTIIEIIGPREHHQKCGQLFDILGSLGSESDNTQQLMLVDLRTHCCCPLVPVTSLNSLSFETIRNSL